MTNGKVNHPRWLFGPYIIRGIGDVLLAIATAVPIAWLLLFIYGLNTSSCMVTYQTWVQRKVPDAVRGRVFTWFDVVWNSAKIISLGVGGWVAEVASIEVVYYMGGTLLFLSGLTGLLLLSNQRLAQS